MYRTQKHLILLSLCLLPLEYGCAPRASATPPRSSADVANEPNYAVDVISPLDSATTEPVLPILRLANGRNGGPCFETIKKPTEWQTEDPRVSKFIAQHKRAVDSAVKTWLQTEVFADMDGISIGRQQISYDKRIVRHVAPDLLAFQESPTCLDTATRRFPLESQVINTLFGAKQITLKSARPFDRSVLRNLKKAAQKAGIRLVPENAYTPAVDAAGKPKKNEKGKRLFNAPSGMLITKKEMPMPKDRKWETWKLIFPKPPFFAFGTMPSGGWQQTPNTPPFCEVFVVFDDTKPQVPVCTTFNRAGFGASRGENENDIVIKVAAANNTVTQTVPFDTPSLIVASERLIVWVTPNKVEEGARLRVDGFWLNTGEETPPIESFARPRKKRSPKKSASDKSSSGKEKHLPPPPVGY